MNAYNMNGGLLEVLHEIWRLQSLEKLGSAYAFVRHPLGVWFFAESLTCFVLRSIPFVSLRWRAPPPHSLSLSLLGLCVLRLWFVPGRAHVQFLIQQREADLW